MTKTAQTLGERRTRSAYRPDVDQELISTIKSKTAKLIDVVNQMEVHHTETEGHPLVSDHKRLKALAITALEEGCMWAVKAATT